MFQKIKKKLPDVLLFCFVFFIFVMPVVMLFIMSITTENGYGINNYLVLMAEKRTQKAIINTIIIAVCSTLIAMLFGTIMAFVVAYTNIRFKKIVEALVLMPYVIPSYVVTLSWSNLFMANGSINKFLKSIGLPVINIYSIGGIVLVMGICNIPVVYLIVISMLRKIPTDMEWASRASGYSVMETMKKIDLVQVMPAVVNGSVLAFLAAIDNFSVPAFLGISAGIPVLSTYIYEKAISFGPTAFNSAAVLSVLLSVIALTGSVLQNRLVKKRSDSESIKEDYTERILLTKGKRIVLEFVCIICLIAVNVVPLISMFTSSFVKLFGQKISAKTFTLENYRFVLTNQGIRKAILNSLFLAVLTCAVCILIGTAIAYIKIRKKSKAAGLAESAASLTYALPGIVLSLAMIFYWSRIPNVYGTIRILMIAYITRYLVLQIKGSTTALLSVDESLEEAARVGGSNPVRTWFRILIPLITKPVLSGSFMIFVSAMTELTLSSMLAAAGTKTIGLTIFNLQQGGDYNKSAAMSAIIVLMLAAGYVIKIFIKKREEGIK